MKICDTVYQLKVEFNVTPQVKRYVYVYIIGGKEGYYLIDAGVKGCQKKIGEYIHKIGKNRENINPGNPFLFIILRSRFCLQGMRFRLLMMCRFMRTLKAASVR